MYCVALHSSLTLLHLVVAAIVTLHLTTLLLSLRTAWAILAADGTYGCKVDVGLAARHNMYIADYRVVIRVLVVELVALRAHKARHIHHLLLGTLRACLRGDSLNETLRILTIVLEDNSRLWVWQLLWHNG